MRVGTDSIDENVGRPFVGAWIENPEGKVMAGKMPSLHRAAGARFTTAAACIEAALPYYLSVGCYSFDLEVFSEVSFLSCL